MRTALDLVPDVLQSGGWQSVAFSLFVVAGAIVMFEIGHWAGALEERNYWAPLEAPPVRLWWRGWRWIELHVVDRIKHRVRPPKRTKAPQVAVVPLEGPPVPPPPPPPGRHRRRAPEPPEPDPVTVPDMQKAPQSVVAD